MMSDEVIQRVALVPVLSDSRAALERLVQQDWTAEDAVKERLVTGAILEQIYRGLGGQTEGYLPLLNAWFVFRASILQLDHIQDDDPSTLPPSERHLTAAEQYMLVYRYCLLAIALLDDLDDASIPGKRIRRLHRLWNDSMLIAASGQQRDLARSGPLGTPEAVLEYYLEMIDAKAGAVYALGIGGIAILATDDQRHITTLIQIGRIFGTLLQFSDDMLDESSQSSPALTLPQVYTRALQASGLSLPSHSLRQYWDRIYPFYYEQVRQSLAPLPNDVQTAIVQLFRNTFER